MGFKRVRFKFCSYRNASKYEVLGVRSEPPPIDSVPPSCYREGQYWIRQCPPDNKPRGFAYVKGVWYEWKGLSTYGDTWTPP